MKHASIIWATLLVVTSNGHVSVVQDVPPPLCKRLACELNRERFCPPVSCDADGNTLWPPPTFNRDGYACSSPKLARAECLDDSQPRQSPLPGAAQAGR
jgi:hypothetical protein